MCMQYAEGLSTSNTRKAYAVVLCKPLLLHSLWVRVLSSIYFRYDDFWSVNAKISNYDFWKCLLSIRHIMYQRSCWGIGRGDNINIWHDVWIPNSHFPIIPIRFYNPMPNIVSDLIISSTRSWNITLIKKIFDLVIVNLITNIHLSQDL